MASQILFLLNDQTITTAEHPGMLVLDFLRRRAALTGTKEGCKEGDCGACGVLIGELKDGAVRYKPVTSCLVPLGEMSGKHLVTVEGLNLAHLSLVQEAIVAEGGTQCGFCTPGIVVSLTGWLMERGAEMDDDDIKYALSGHLCRCTGYNSLKRAGRSIIDGAAQLQNGKNAENKVAAMVTAGMLPEYFLEVPERLTEIQEQLAVMKPRKSAFKKNTVFIAGGTDIYVQRGDTIPQTPVELLNRNPEIHGIREADGEVHVGALTTFEEFASDTTIQRVIPEIQSFMQLNASLQIRNRASLGGNIVNASPIGDMTIFLLALDSRLILKNKEKVRSLPMKKFFLDYKKLDKQPSEIVTEIIFSTPTPYTKINFEKASKRRYLDIASVNSAICIETEEDMINKVNLTVGGVAPIPLFLQEASTFLTGKPIKPEILEEALIIAQGEISPISDVRGSIEYKRLLTRQFMIAHFAKLFPEWINLEAFLREIA